MLSGAKTDCETLLSSVFPFAKQTLSKNGEFFPFSGAMLADGEVIGVGGYTGTEQPPSSELIQFLKEDLIAAARRGEYKATAIVCDVKVNLPTSGETSEAIAVSLNHRDNYSVMVIFPYKLEHGQLTFGDTYAEIGEDDIFSPQ